MKRAAMRKSLIETLIKLNGTDPKIYLTLLTTDHIKYLYPILIEAE